MELISKILIILYNMTNNIGTAVFILSISIGIISVSAKYFNLKNNIIKNKYGIEVDTIKETIADPELQLEEIKKIYAKDGYKYILPVAIQIILAILNIAIFATILNLKKYIPNINEIPTQSFLYIKDIFAPQKDFIIPIICGIITLICNNIYKMKYIKIKDFGIEILTCALLIVGLVLYSNLFGPIYLIYVLGTYLIKPILMIIFYKKTKELFFYQQKYQEYRKNKNISVS